MKRAWISESEFLSHLPDTMMGKLMSLLTCKIGIILLLIILTLENCCEDLKNIYVERG